MQAVTAYLASLVVFGAVDAIWLAVTGPALYRPTLRDILLTDLRLVPAVIFYLSFPAGIVVFAALPGLRTGTITPAALHGLLFGALCYATYDLTNYATLRNWTLQLTVIDIVYGAVATMLAASVAAYAARALAG
jgi:uncharacterized membrane protein